MNTVFKNPFRPGAGHMPPYLAGRQKEQAEFQGLLTQDVILENLILTGLRGVGKSVLLDTLKPAAVDAGWWWVGTDLSESTSITEESISIRLLTDLSVLTSGLVVHTQTKPPLGLTGSPTVTERTLDYGALHSLWQNTPGLAADKLKGVLERAWTLLQPFGKRGIIFAYDEAQNLADHAERDQYPLSLMLDVFQSIQRKNMPLMLVLTGLPTIFPKLVEARTYSERMFHQVFLERLPFEDTKLAISKPVSDSNCPVRFSDESITQIHRESAGYPYFIQYICREVYDVWSQNAADGVPPRIIPMDEITRKLDTDFFAGRWARATDRQRDLLSIIASLALSSGEFTVQEVVERSKSTERPFSSSHVNQMLVSLASAGLVYKNRWARYSFAVPLLDQFIKRQPRHLL
jgi:hypothetical protein